MRFRRTPRKPSVEIRRWCHNKPQKGCNGLAKGRPHAHQQESQGATRLRCTPPVSRHIWTAYASGRKCESWSRNGGVLLSMSVKPDPRKFCLGTPYASKNGHVGCVAWSPSVECPLPLVGGLQGRAFEEQPSESLFQPLPQRQPKNGPHPKSNSNRPQPHPQQCQRWATGAFCTLHIFGGHAQVLIIWHTHGQSSTATVWKPADTKHNQKHATGTTNRQISSVFMACERTNSTPM